MDASVCGAVSECVHSFPHALVRPSNKHFFLWYLVSLTTEGLKTGGILEDAEMHEGKKSLLISLLRNAHC